MPEPIAEAVRIVFGASVAPIGSETLFIWGPEQRSALGIPAGAQDPRLAWLIADVMCFVWQAEPTKELAGAADILLERTWAEGDPWNQILDHLIAWDILAPPNYLRVKKGIYTTLIQGWDRLLVEEDIDWRLITWGTAGLPWNSAPAG